MAQISHTLHIPTPLIIYRDAGWVGFFLAGEVMRDWALYFWRIFYPHAFHGFLIRTLQVWIFYRPRAFLTPSQFSPNDKFIFLAERNYDHFCLQKIYLFFEKHLNLKTVPFQWRRLAESSKKLATQQHRKPLWYPKNICFPAYLFLIRKL